MTEKYYVPYGTCSLFVKKTPAGKWYRIENLTFHDLRHDFAHRAREAGWTLEEVAYYLGHVTKKGTSAVQTTVRYTQVSRELVKQKLKHIKGYCGSCPFE